MDHLARHGIRTSSWHQIATMPELSHLRGYDGEIRHGIDRLAPGSRALLVATLLYAQYEHVICPLLDQGLTVVSDSYYYRFFAKEKLYGKAHPLLYKTLVELPEPDLVLMLDLPPEQAYARKQGKVKRYEYHRTSTFDDYVRFQKQVLRICQDLIPVHKLRHIDAQRSIIDVAEEVVAAVEEVRVR